MMNEMKWVCCGGESEGKRKTKRQEHQAKEWKWKGGKARREGGIGGLWVALVAAAGSRYDQTW
jgi:hypothetical protein